MFGKRAPNVMITEIRKDCKKYEEGLTKAGQSNQELHRAMNTHITNLKLLSGPLDDLEKALPAQDRNVCKWCVFLMFCNWRMFLMFCIVTKLVNHMMECSTLCSKREIWELIIFNNIESTGPAPDNS